MKKTIKTIVILILSIITVSCGTSSDVAGKFGIQKRKYTKGFSISKKTRHKISKTSLNQDVLAKYSELSSTNVQIASVKNDSQPIAILEVETNKNETPITAQLVSEKPMPIEITKLTSLKHKVKSKVVSHIIQKKSEQISVKSTAELSDRQILYYVLAVLIPFIAVGLVTNWDTKLVVISILLSLLFVIPGIIFGIIIVNKYL